MVAVLALRILVTAIVVLALAACGEDREGSVEQSGTETTGTGTTGTGATGTSTTPAKATGPVVATVKVSETEFALDPANPKVSEAGLVQFDVTNAGQVPHALEVEGPGGEVETETIAPGAKATLKADLSKAGTYVWYCPVADHEKRGMRGKITVAGGGTGTTTDSSGGRDDSGMDDSGMDDSGKEDDSGKSGGSGGY